MSSSIFCSNCGMLKKNCVCGKYKREKKTYVRKEKRRKNSIPDNLLDMNGPLPNNPGIYKLVNKRSGEVFVSSSKNISKGVKRHLSNLRMRSHDNKDLQEDYDKGDRFGVVILQQYNVYDKKIINKDTMEWIESENSYERGYNRTLVRGIDPYRNNPNHYTGRRLDGSPSSR